jgi:FkbM family methyltransferase
MITIDGHTFDENLIQDGWIIDAGCRGFKLYYNFRPLGKHKYYGVDIENFEQPHNAIFKQAALTTHSGQIDAYYFGDGTGNFIKGINEKPGDLPDRPLTINKVNCITLQDIYNEIGTNIDLLKLDIEGAEYEILLDIEPIPKQITVEFHEHCHEHLHKKYIDKIMDQLCKNYRCQLNISI